MAIIGTSIMGSRLKGPGWADRLDAELRQLEGAGIRAAEISPTSVEAIKNGRLDLKRAEKTADVLGAHDLRVSVHVPGRVNLMHRQDGPRSLDVLLAALQFTEAIGSDLFVYHPGRFVDIDEAMLGTGGIPDGLRQEALEKEAATLKGLAGEFRSVTIGMENMLPYRDGLLYSYAEHIDQLKKQVLCIDEGNVRITLDLGHMYIASRSYGFDPVAAARDIAPLIAHTHVHDNFGGSLYHFQQQTLVDFGLGDAHMPVGHGEIPLPNILATYAGAYRGVYLMELADEYYEYMEESGKSLAGILGALE